MDETMIHLFPKAQRGFVAAGTGSARKVFLCREEKSSLGERRQCTSLLAMISDVKVVNDLLPLILLVNERHVKAEPIASLQQHYANDDHCWPLRFESAWNDTTTMVWLLEVLRKALRDILSEYSICLLLDVASCHIVTE